MAKRIGYRTAGYMLLLLMLGISVWWVLGHEYQTPALRVVGEERPPQGVTRIISSGDFSCPPKLSKTEDRCQSEAVFDAMRRRYPDSLLLLGDLQYYQGEEDYFNQVFDKEIGSLKPIARPSVGNHEYETKDAAGYFSYWNGTAVEGQAGVTGKGWYSFDIGNWHIIALNSNCEFLPDGCSRLSEQGQWLAADLAANTKPCTIAFWHHPKFSTSKHSADAYTARLQDFWQLLYDARAEIVLNGHDHVYERFAPQRPDGTKDIETGIRQFTAGAGGKDHHPFVRRQTNREYGNNTQFGFLELDVTDNAYSWEFITLGGAVLDEGSGTCRP